jgi:hypothetical protein
MTYPRQCPSCGVMREEADFYRDRHQPSGRKSSCRVCCLRAARVYHVGVRKPRREASRGRTPSGGGDSPARAQERLRALHKEAVEAARRQKRLLREPGVPDLSPEEVAERARRGAYR